MKFVRKRKHEADSEEVAGPLKPKRTVTTSGPLLPKDSCIFCNKKFKKKVSKGVPCFEKLVKCVTKTAEQSIQDAAKTKQDDIFTHYQDTDLVAREAHYHEGCRKDYLRCEDRHAETSTDQKTAERLQAHERAFEYICKYVENALMRGSQVERMTMLREKYCEYMQQYSPDFYNPGYKTYKLKEKLMKYIGFRIKFWAPNHRSDLVYRDELARGQAVETAFVSAASEERRLEESAHVLRRHIMDAFRATPDMPWPPSAEFLQSDAVKPPDILTDFLKTMLSGNSSSIEQPKTTRLASSIAQDICYSVTGGKWKMPKHVLLGMSVRHVTGSSEIISLLNRFGHVAGYKTIVRLETAMANSVLQCASLLPSTVSLRENKVIHFCWDNFDLNEETPSGADTTHSTHGIVIQEVTGDTMPDTFPSQTEPPSHHQNRQCSVQYEPHDVPPCFAKEKAEPMLHVVETHFSNPEAVYKAQVADFWWIFSRSQATDENQLVPGWGGWVSPTGEGTEKIQSTVDYMAPIHHPVTENSTVQHILKVSQAATKQVGQDVT